MSNKVRSFCCATMSSQCHPVAPRPPLPKLSHSRCCPEAESFRTDLGEPRFLKAAIASLSTSHPACPCADFSQCVGCCCIGPLAHHLVTCGKHFRVTPAGSSAVVRPAKEVDRVAQQPCGGLFGSKAAEARQLRAREAACMALLIGGCRPRTDLEALKSAASAVCHFAASG